MKIGIITTQSAPNYGALLQTYALQEFLKDNTNSDIYVVNYLPPYSAEGWRIYQPNNSLKSIILNLYVFLNFKVKKLTKKRQLKLKAFIKSELNLSKACFSEEDLISLKYNVYICGSDQIWNMNRRQDSNYFLYFTRQMADVKRIAYAPSIAAPIPEQYIDIFKEYINNIDYLSVREEDDVEQVKKLTEKKIVDVCDPVFLMNDCWWRNKIKGIPCFQNRKYILCYFLSTTPLAIKTVEKIKSVTGLPILHININFTEHFKSDFVIRDANPFEFLAYIRDAEYIVTNSFHCSAFSLIFKKNLTIVGKHTANRRMKNILKHTGMEDLFVTEEKLNQLSVEQLSVDYSNSNYVSEKWINNSKEYLLNSLFSEEV